MIRTFLGVGDKATNGAYITQGLDSVSCSNPPPRVQISTIGMTTYCPVCKQDGHIGPRGPRRPGMAPNGKQWALSGDINLCGCNPPPTFHAERNMTMTFTSDEVAALMGGGSSAAFTTSAASHWISFALKARGDCSGLRCVAYFKDGSVQQGVLGTNNLVRFERSDNNSACSHVEFMLDDGNAAVSGSVTDSLLAAIGGRI